MEAWQYSSVKMSKFIKMSRFINLLLKLYIVAKHEINSGDLLFLAAESGLEDTLHE